MISRQNTCTQIKIPEHYLQMSHMSVGPGLPTGLAGPCALGPGGACPGVLGFGAAVGRRMDFGAAGWGSTIVTLFATPSGGLGSPSSTFLFFCSCCSRYCLASAAEGPVGGGHIGGFGLGGFGVAVGGVLGAGIFPGQPRGG